MIILLGLLSVSVFASNKALAANPTAVNFQGKVVNADGTNVTNGTYSFVFRIYNTSSPTPTTACGSDSSCLFEETQSSVSVANGTFQVELGSTCSGGLVASNACTKSAAGGLNFNSNNALYLTLQFNGDTSGSHGGFMWPVIHLTSVPYAYYADNAGSLGGISSNNFVQLATGNLQTDNTTNNSIAINKTGASGDILLLEANSKKALEVNNGGTVSLGQAGASGLNGTLTFNNSAGSNTVSLSLQANPGSSSYTLLLPTTGPSTSQCLQTDSTTANQLKFASCGGGTSSLAATYNSAATTGNTIALAQNGGGIIIQDASTPITGSDLFDVQSNGGSPTNFLSVAATGVTVTNLTTTGNITVGSGSYLKLTGSGTRPASPTEGTLYYDTTTHTLLTYNGSKWMSDKSAATKIVAMGTATGCTGTSPVASANPDGADYVVTSCTDAAGATNGTTANTINAALAAVGSAGGGMVYLEEGTYIISTNAITVPSNVTLEGSGPGTIIKFKSNVGSGTYYAIENGTSANNINVQNLTIDGNNSSQIAGSMYGVYYSSVTSGKIINITVQNMGYSSGNNGIGIDLRFSSNIVISNNTVTGNGSCGILIESTSTNNTVAGNIVNNNTRSGINVDGNNNSVSGNTANSGQNGINITGGWNSIAGNTSNSNSADGIFLGSNYNTVTGNTISSNATGVLISSAVKYNNITGNTLDANTTYAIDVSSASNNQISSNKIHDNGGTTTNNAIYFEFSPTNNSITNNDITDSSCSSTCYAINISSAGSINNYLASNHFLGDGTHTASINNPNNDVETFANQPLTESGDASFRNATNSAAAFQIQNSTAASLLAANTTARATGTTGNIIKIGSGANTDTGTTVLVLDSYNGGVAGALATNLTSLNGGLYYNSSTNHINVIENGAVKEVCNKTDGCGVTTLANGYNSAATTGNTITLASSGGPVVVQDNGTPLSGSLFTVQSNACASANCKYLNVSSSGASIAALSSAALQVQNASGTAVLTVNTSAAGVTVAGNLNQSGGTVSLSANGTSSFSTSSGTLSLDGNGGLNLGTGTSTILIGETSAGSTQVQSANGLIIGTASVTGQLGIYNGSNKVTIEAGASTNTYNFILPATSGTAGYCLANTVTPGTLQWLPCGASATATITLTPEYPGATMSADGSSNTGTMTSDFCANTAGGLPNINTGACASGQYHNYYSWTSASGTNNYDVWVRWQAPTDFASLSSLTAYGWRTTSSSSVKVTIFDGSTQCTTTPTDVATGTATWTSASVPNNSCAITAGDVLTLRVKLTAAATEFARAGEITITYNRN